jgi:hypothetical protein
MECGWERFDVGEALVESQQDAPALASGGQHDRIRRPREALLRNGVGIVPRSAEIVQALTREILVELDPHAGRSGRRLSSRASSAA